MDNIDEVLDSMKRALAYEESLPTSKDQRVVFYLSPTMEASFRERLRYSPDSDGSPVTGPIAFRGASVLVDERFEGRWIPYTYVTVPAPEVLADKWRKSLKDRGFGGFPITTLADPLPSPASSATLESAAPAPGPRS